MDDPIRPSAETFRSIYEESFRLWSRLYLRAVEDSRLPASCLSIENAFPHHPSFPRNLSLKHVKDPEYGYVKMYVTTNEPLSLSIAETPDRHFNFASWFPCHDQNHLAVLILAWAYVLSARWVDTMPEGCSLKYTSSQAACYHDGEVTGQQADQSLVKVDIGDASSEEVRWWAAILAPEQGWQATMTLDQDEKVSPWSVRLPSKPRFLVSRKRTASPPPSPPHSAPSFADAVRSLDSFCVRHNIMDQSYAALAAVLLFPTLSEEDEVLQLPAPTAHSWSQSTQMALPYTLEQRVDSTRQLQRGWMYQDKHLDRLLTMSCHISGIRPMLLSVFYEARIECNVVSPWLQGALAVIDSLAGENPTVLARMFMDRVPEVGFLWLGSTILGVQKTFLNNVKYGELPVNLHSAAWSGTIQSFIQQPVSNPLVTNGYVSRADECRLLSLSPTIGFRSWVPLCQWRPFGATPLEITDIEIRLHEKCGDHRLQYQGFAWNCVNGQVESRPVDNVDTYTALSRSPAHYPHDEVQIPIDYGAMNREREFTSVDATLMIMRWLRSEGHTRHERDMWEHKWFAVLKSSDGSEPGDYDSENSSCTGPKSPSYVRSWISGLEE
ncbi:hypothetical protein GGS23DRAFT_604176 [Durotheca rogersii]|uniref:uncharacterized protein n=1 Tax=Durotheca rogersii TaxID=419775 RepID=UPI00221FE292|nr:uncharacterized protein GGS23DRAFT_604176 [Durotheca rogersii]KAI5864548.1 hypothetical protein GGS23DRAFT_604176 [Durotheca rogersii]